MKYILSLILLIFSVQAYPGEQPIPDPGMPAGLESLISDYACEDWHKISDSKRSLAWKVASSDQRIRSIRALDIAPDGSRLAVVDRNRLIVTDNFQDTGYNLQSVRVFEDKETLCCLKFFGGGSKIATGSVGEVTIWDVGTGQRDKIIQCNGLVRSLDVIRHNQKVKIFACVSEYNSSRVVMIDVQAGIVTTLFVGQSIKCAKACTDSVSGGMKVAIGNGREIVIIDVTTQNVVQRWDALQDKIGNLEHFLDENGNNKLVSQGLNGGIKIWDVATQQSEQAIVTERGYNSDLVLYTSADQQTRIMSRLDDTTIAIWDTQGRIKQQFTMDENAAEGCVHLASTADGSMMTLGIGQVLHVGDLVETFLPDERGDYLELWSSNRFKHLKKQPNHIKKTRINTVGQWMLQHKLICAAIVGMAFVATLPFKNQLSAMHSRMSSFWRDTIVGHYASDIRLIK